MRDKCYLLALEDFMKDASGERLLEAAFDKVDAARRERAERMQSGKARAACLGAGLLLQLAVQEAFKETERNGEANAGVGMDKKMLLSHMSRSERNSYGLCVNSDELSVYTVPQVLEMLSEPLDLKLYYGEKGKPYLRDYPFYFNLSHSGEYVFCAISDREVGADIQQFRPADEDRLVKRFFSEEECKALTACLNKEEQREFFYRLWTRKEAYGKLTGEGIAASVGCNVLPADMLAQPDGGLQVQQSINIIKVQEALGGIMRHTVERAPLAKETEGGQPLFWQEWSFQEYRLVLCQYDE